MPKTTLIIDGYGFIFRAYHSLPPLTDSTGTPVGAVFGFTSMLLKILAEFKPNHAVIVFDHGTKTFRHELFNQYKMNRPEAPEDLKVQFPICRQAASALNFKIIEKPGFEADDIIATLAREVVEKNEKAIIVSSDKDLMQLVNTDIIMYDSLKGKYITEKEVIEKFGVPPSQVRDVLAIIGDSSDNIPGIHGIGPKGAAELIKKYGSLEELIAHADEITQPKRKQSIIDSKEKAVLSKQLITLNEKVPLDLVLQDLEYKQPKPEELFSFLQKHGFKSIITKAEKLFNIHSSHSLSVPFRDNKPLQTIILNSIDSLKTVLQASVFTGKLAIYFVVERKEILGIALTTNGKQSYYINISQNNDLFSLALSETQFKQSKILEILKPYFEDSSVLKIMSGVKEVLNILGYRESNGEYKYCNILGCHDITLMHYSINTGNDSSELYSILHEYINDTFPSINSILQANKAKSLKSLKQADLIEHFCYISDALFHLHPMLKQDLKKQNSISIFNQIDMPLTFVLHEMEQYGVKIDQQKLADLSKTFAIEIESLEENIFKIAGQKFNIGSPKQLGEALFGSMGLPSGKISTKSGVYSTSADVLENLSEAGFEIADLILKWRQITKLKNTYTDTLPEQINPLSGRIHTTFLQTSTNTGRLSSQDPNLQNIPIRTELGERIREAFIAEKGWKLISADYSQIELRLLSHIADIKALKEAFIAKKDIHTETACQVFKINPGQVTSDIRRKAKAINFGIIYGISSFGLGKQLGISSREAAKYIEQYFKEYPGIELYMDKMKNIARKEGFVKSLFGRRCYIKHINDKNFSLRSFSERAAINAPLQGTTADIAKIAMIKLYNLLKNQGFRTRMLLQVHDELLFESPEEEVEVIMPIIQYTMQNIIQLSVPLIVDIKAGNNWSEIH